MRPFLPFAFAPALLFALTAQAKNASDNTDNPAYLKVTVSLVADPSGVPAPASAFIHPGVLVNRKQLEEIARRVAAGTEPQKSAAAALLASPGTALTYAANPRAAVECGSFSNPDLGCKAEQRDSEAAYAQALAWVVTGNEAYAQKAIAIMNAWAITLQNGHSNANGPIQAAWCAEVWPRAAEIIRYTYRKWPDAGIARFQNLLRTQYLPSLVHGCTENGNKELSMAEALINCGVFLDDQAVYQLGVTMWRGRTPAYIYLKSDGPRPIEPIGAGPAIWGNKGHTPALVDGLLQETARDSQHANLALASMVNAAETARQQGLDLYGEAKARIEAALEFQAQYLKPNSRPAPAHLEFNAHPTWEIAYNEYHNRDGDSLPLMAKVIALKRPTGINHMMNWETLTHGEMGAIGLPPLKPAKD